ncbi:DUF4260 family protein [Carnobacterium sp. 17-4]|uniref:DUF4260 family protein n=1 Tax=Carnobacterium sp. (strain 17-4) TaxID=208596 RepID=UPI0009FC954B
MLLIFFFLIDISLLSYLINKQIGAYIYNFAHNLIAPCVLLVFGYELKYLDDFKHTHIS